MKQYNLWRDDDGDWHWEFYNHKEEQWETGGPFASDFEAHGSLMRAMQHV